MLIAAVSLTAVLGMASPASASTHLGTSTVKCVSLSFGTYCEQMEMRAKNTSFCNALLEDIKDHPSFRGFPLIGGTWYWIASIPVVLGWEYGSMGASYGYHCINYHHKDCLTSQRFSSCTPD